MTAGQGFGNAPELARRGGDPRLGQSAICPNCTRCLEGLPRVERPNGDVVCERCAALLDEEGR